MNRLKELRLLLGWNMKKAADEIGMKYTTYIGYEKGEREMNSEVLVRFADFYGCTVDFLIGKDEDEKNTATESDGKKNAIDRLKEVIPSLTEQQAEFLLPQVLGLISSQRDQDSHK